MAKSSRDAPDFAAVKISEKDGVGGGHEEGDEDDLSVDDFELNSVGEAKGKTFFGQMRGVSDTITSPRAGETD